MGKKRKHSEKKRFSSLVRVALIIAQFATSRNLHLMLNVISLLSHCKKDNKVESKATKGATLNELVELKSCSSCLFFECRKHKDLDLWMARCPNGPSVKFLFNAGDILFGWQILELLRITESQSLTMIMYLCSQLLMITYGAGLPAMGVNNKTEEIKFGVFLLCLFGISIGLFAIYGRTFVQEYKHHRIPLYVLVIVLIIYGIIALFFIICIGGSGLLTIYYQLAWDKTAPTCAIAPADSSDTDRKVEPQLHEDV